MATKSHPWASSAFPGALVTFHLLSQASELTGEDAVRAVSKLKQEAEQFAVLQASRMKQRN